MGNQTLPVPSSLIISRIRRTVNRGALQVTPLSTESSVMSYLASQVHDSRLIKSHHAESRSSDLYTGVYDHLTFGLYYVARAPGEQVDRCDGR